MDCGSRTNIDREIPRVICPCRLEMNNSPTAILRTDLSFSPIAGTEAALDQNLVLICE
jgi:hypothetical protein